ncbi:MAG: SDR family NAD(P)-dependent oxidoreductase [Acidimicrobiia bacterium]
MGDRKPTALVTGSSSGIGLATARQLLEASYRVGLLDISPSQVEHPEALPFQVDLRDLNGVREVVAAAARELGSFQVLVNCAGWDQAMPFVETDDAFWKKVIEINLLGPIALTHAALAHLEDGGAIVNVASDAGRVGSSGEVVYSAAKGGIIAFTKALAREMAKRGIRVNAVAPGPTDTPFLSGFDESGRLAEAMIRQTPLRKLATPDDIADAISFLASPAAGHITGQVLSVSGGLTMV